MRKSFYLVTALVFVFSISAYAWNSIGHRTVAELAWRNLTPAQRNDASALLKHHPHYHALLAGNVPTDADTNEWVFLTAAVWPDMVRQSRPGHPQKDQSITKYDLYPHAIGYPFVRSADRDFVSTKDFYIAEPNAEMVLSNSLVTLADRTASAHDRAVSLCWALHLMGDLHQPLHAATWVRRDKKEWDGLGGNYIVLDPSGKPSPEKINMHSFWDQLPGVTSGYQPVAGLADQLEADKQIKKETRKDYRKHKTIASWVQESFRLAVDFAYAEDKVQFAHIDDLASGKVPESAIPLLKQEYVDGARTIAHQRLVLAGQRLSEPLNKAFPAKKKNNSTRR